FQQVWKEAQLSAGVNPKHTTGPWLIFADTQGLSDRAAAILRERGETVTVVRAGNTVVRHENDEIEIGPASRAHYDELLAMLRANGRIPRRILHMWSVLDLIPRANELDELDHTMVASFWSILYFAQAFGTEINATIRCRLAIGSNNLAALEQEQCERPERALLAGPCGVIPKELPNLQCVHVDFAMPSGVTASNGNRDRALEEIAQQIISELDSNTGDSPVAYRRGERFARMYEPVARAQQPIKLRHGAVHLISGGLGGIGLALAEEIAQAPQARIVLLGRRSLPPRNEWSRIIGADGELAVTLRKIEAIEQTGAEVMSVAADVTDEAAMRAALAAIHQRFGAVTGVIHAAGTIADAPLLTKTQASAAAVLAPKIKGTLVLERVLADEPLAYVILCSSVSSIVAPAGQMDYAAANAFLDAFAQSRSGKTQYPIIALQYPRWWDVGMAADPDVARERSSAASPNLAQDGTRRHEITAETTLSVASDWIVREHRTRDGTGIFPGTGYVEMILKAAQTLMPDEPITIHDLQFELPLEVVPGVTRRLRTRLARHEGDYRFEASVQTQGGWEECASARVTPERDGAPAAYDLSALRGQCADRELTFTHRQNRIQESFFDFGPRWRVLARIGFGQGEALVSVELAAEFLDDLDSYNIHPALLDMATGAGLFLIPDYESKQITYVPMNYGRLTVRRRLPAHLYSYIRIHPGSSGDDEIAIFDADILDEEGNRLVEVREFMMRRIEDGVRLSAHLPADLRTSKPSRDQLTQPERPPDSFSAIEGIAAYRRVLDGEWAANVVAFPSNFAAYAQAAQRAQAVGHRAVGLNGADGAPSGEPMRDEIERTLGQWWHELLGAESLTPQSDFFEMGGQSLTAVRLFAKIKKSYGLQLSPATIYEAPTIEKLAQRVRDAKGAKATESSLIPIRTGGSRPPLFLFPDMNGTVIGFDTLVRLLPGSLPIYGAESTWFRHGEMPLRLEEMAARHLESIRALQRHGPFFLLGYSFGGLMAFEAAQQLTAQGETIGMLGMLDTWQLGHIRDLEAVHRRSQKLVRRARKAMKHAQRLWAGPERLAYFDDYFIARYRRKLSLWIFALLVRYAHGGRALPQFLRSPSQVNMFAAQRYIARHYQGRITMFRAAQGIANDDPRYGESLGWQSVAEQGVEIHEVPGTHRDILREPNVRILAREISNACINSAPTSEFHSVSISPH
ncbi:MAG TPA: SDR family NAD(P)-dependent oxidoreductase, partial [Candidatus Binataceae bacterium]|nr:SDR family NAD(P)-dependent oxidoreductase [Candidatus Binataceae bacterium]